MRKFEDISQDVIKHIANKHHVDPSIIKGLIEYWKIELALNDYYKPLQKLDLPNDEIDTIYDELAQLCLLYHDHSVFNSENPEIFTNARFKYSRSGKLFKLSRHFANQVIKSYFEKLKADGNLLNRAMAEEILEEYHHHGKRQIKGNIERNWLIKIGAEYLKTLKVERKYAQIISDIFIHLGENISPGNVRKIATGSKSN